MAVRMERRQRLSPKIPFDTEVERYHPDLEAEIQQVQAELRHNQMLFDLEVQPDLVEQLIYERQALYCRYRFLIGEARRLGLHALLTSHE